MSGFGFDFKDIIEEAGDVIVVTKAWPISSPGPEIVYVNKAFTKLTGYSYDEAVGGDPRMLQSTDTDPETKDQIRDALIKQKPVRVTIKNYSKQGEGYWLDMNILPLRDADGKVTHFVAIERDVTESKELEFKLNQLSRHDPLSGLLNRRAFDESIELEMSRFFKTGNVFTVLALDIDHFKKVNDKYGHQAGDRVIQKVSAACESMFGQMGHVARTGGEEFTILIPGMDAHTAEPAAEALRKKIASLSVTTDIGLIKFTSSIGVSEVGSHDKIASQILVRADKALYEAKKKGRNKVCLDKIVSCDSLSSSN
jgi:diguanylate cyclase (GGDEF)-like protein/PAS domain S-box-containing protein